MNKENDFIIVMLIVVSAIIGFTGGFFSGAEHIQREAVKTSCAQYNKYTGDFEWIKLTD